MLYFSIAILLIFLAFVVYLSTLNGNYTVERQHRYDEDKHTIFAKIRDFRSRAEWNPWLLHEPDATLTYSENTTDVDAEYSWDGTVIGAGSIRRSSMVLPQRIEEILTFQRPFKSTAKVIYELQEIGGQTELTWTMHARMPFFMRFMVPKMQSMIGHDYELGLALLAGALNPTTEHPKIDFVGVKSLKDQHCLCQHFKGEMSEMQKAMEVGFPALFQHALKEKIEITAPARSVYYRVDVKKKYFECDMALPVSKNTDPGEYTHKTINGGKFYEVTVMGSYNFLEAAWYTAMSHVYMIKMKHDPSRPSIEVYESDPMSVAHSNEIKTVLYIPIK